VSVAKTPPEPDGHPDKKLTTANRDLWDAWTRLHVTSEFYDVPGFKSGQSSLDSVELGGVGDVRGRSLLHLQCHFGLDTLSFARLGARVTGVDFSSEAIGHARRLATELGLEARFVYADVTQALSLLEGEEFDVVFTSYGALSWLPELGPWARTIAGALKPAGRFFVADHHPTVWIFDDESREMELRYRYGYFDRGALRTEEKGSYAVPDGDYEGVSYCWQHTFDDIVGSLLAAGLRITSLREYPYLSFQWFPFMEKGDDGFWRMPEGGPDIPLMFSLTATKDVGSTHG
jgi:SAM-dependent methyltransferase